MIDEVVTQSIRKFLKQVGVTSHQRIESAIEQAKQSGQLQGKTAIKAIVRLEIADLDLEHSIESEISLK